MTLVFFCRMSAVDAKWTHLISWVKYELLQLFERFKPEEKEGEFYVLIKQCVEKFFQEENYRDGYDWKTGYQMKKSVSDADAIIIIKSDIMKWIQQARQYISEIPRLSVAFMNLLGVIESKFADDLKQRPSPDNPIQRASSNATPEDPALTAELQAKFDAIEMRLLSLETKVNAVPKKGFFARGEDMDTLLRRMKELTA